ncbi:MAG: hypothetical protein JRH11_26530 [Deltaproteobacteria bacterium]|nr:hypothetical protein [Deltaproteobacteria bacterium]
MLRVSPWLATSSLGPWVLAASLVGLVVSSCSSEPTDETPEGALTLFLEAMERADWDDTALEDAYVLLSPAARGALEERAERANALSRREFAPWEMLAQGRFRLRFRPSPGSTETRVEGESAIVTLLGRREGERADVAMVRENGRWRVDLTLPPISTD